MSQNFFYLYVPPFVHVCNMYICMSVYKYMCLYISMHVYYIHIYIRIFFNIYIHIYIVDDEQLRVWSQSNNRLLSDRLLLPQVHTSTLSHTHTHTHTRTQTLPVCLSVYELMCSIKALQRHAKALLRLY